MMKLLIAATLLLSAWSAAAAADDRGTVRVRVGGGAQVRPEFVGSDKTHVVPLFNFKVARGAKQFSFGAPDDSPSLGVVSKGGFTAGPAVNVEGRRREKDVGAPVGSLPTTYRVGGFAQYEAGDSFRVRVEALKAVNGHHGMVGTIGADKIWRSGDQYVFSVGPRVLFADARFQRAYFGVTPAASVASGLPTYRPSGGVYAVAAATGLTYRFGGGPWGVFGYARYERLVGQAAKSPIIREFGSRNQYSGGIGLNYTFSIHAY